MSFRRSTTVGAPMGLVLLVLILAAGVVVDATTHDGFSKRSNAMDVMMTKAQKAAAPAPAPSNNGSKSATPPPKSPSPPSKSPSPPPKSPSPPPKSPSPPPKIPSPPPSSSGGKGAVFDLRQLGAKGDGSSDDTQYFVQAWNSACYSTGGKATILVPKGYSFVMQDMMVFSGKKCLSSITFQVDGTMLGPSKWKGKSSTSSWMQFQDCKNFVLQGKGTLYARGESFWPSGNGGPAGIRFLRATSASVLGITIRATPQVHLKFNYANGVLIQGIKIDSPEWSPNTDGIHLQTNVYNVQILDSVISSGDDCISIGTTTYNVIIKNILCGPGHGISIGSLGNKGLLACVSDIDVSNVTFTNTLCGARIKTCAGGKGKAARITYRDIKLNNVKYPILIDQYYCGKTVKSDNVIIDSVSFLNVQGTWAYSKLAPVTFDCAPPGCTNLRLQNINIWPSAGSKAYSSSYCSYSYGSYGGTMNPKGCLSYKAGANSASAAGCSA